MKKTLAIILTLVMCLGITNGVFAAGKEFSDVKPTDWFYNDVKTAVELGLVNGKGEDTYAPNDNLTYAEAIKLAACMHQIYTTGKIDIAPGNPWYVPYVDYCLTNSIISKPYDYSANATRAGYMEIFANALPGDGLKAINSVAADSIPDVPSSAPYAEGVYKLYRAGILQGVDAAHNCSPNNNIVRSEVAAILTRMMNPEKRVKFTLGEAAPELKVTDPIGGTVEVGVTIATSINVSGGKAPYTYKWEYNDGNGWKAVSGVLGKVSGEDTNRVSIKGEESAYKVRCVVTDANGTEAITNETDFVFKASAALKFDRQPVDLTVAYDGILTASVRVSGGKAPYTYQWICQAGDKWYQFDEVYGITGTKTADLAIKPSAATSMVVCCIVKDSTGKQITSKEATLTVNEKPAEKEPEVTTQEPLIFKKQSTKITVNSGVTVPFEVQVIGGVAPYTYQWFIEKDGVKAPLTAEDGFSGVTEPTLKVKAGDSPLLLYCEVTDSQGNKITSKTMQLVLKAAALSIATQPVDATVAVGEDAKLSVVAKGGQAPYTYQWQMNIGTGWVRLSENDLIIGTTTSELTLKSTAQSYIDVRCVVRDAAGATVESNGVRATFK